MKKKACFVCLKNCVRIHGDEDEDPDEEITPAGSSGPAPNENVTTHEPGPKENVASEPCPSFLKKMTELSITSALVCTTCQFTWKFTFLPLLLSLVSDEISSTNAQLRCSVVIISNCQLRS